MFFVCIACKYAINWFPVVIFTPFSLTVWTFVSVENAGMENASMETAGHSQCPSLS